MLVSVAFTGARWYDGTRPAKFSDVHDALDQFPDAAGYATAYFGWLGWVLLVLVVAAGLAANARTNWSEALRFVAPLLAVAGVLFTAVAIRLSENDDYSLWFDHVSLGFWLAEGGFLVAGLGGVLGPRRPELLERRFDDLVAGDAEDE